MQQGWQRGGGEMTQALYAHMNKKKKEYLTLLATVGRDKADHLPDSEHSHKALFGKVYVLKNIL
jgi:hypothetical protein